MTPRATPKTPRELRRFGLTVGGVFLLLGTISRWRGHFWPPLGLWAIGTALVVPGLLAPSILGPVERAWMRFAEGLSWFNTRVILGALFYVLITPVGWVLRRWRDPMDRRMDDGRSSEWIKRPAETVDPTRYRQQF